jgi:hypothetical protein
MAQLSELKRGKVMKIAVLSMLLLMFTGLMLALPGVTIAEAYVEPDGWTDPALGPIQDTNSTPSSGGTWWIDDAKGAGDGYSGQQQRELLYLFIDFDDDYIYVRWDVEVATPEEFTSIYYLIKVDTEPPFGTNDENATHALGVEIDSKGVVKVSIRVPTSGPKFDIVWLGNPVTDYSLTWIGTQSGDPFLNRTAVEARFPWSWPADGYPAGNLTASGGPEDILVITAESHSNQGDQGWTSEVMDYIGISGNTVPWFTDLALTLLATTVLAVVIKKKKVSLPINVGSGS